MPGHKAPEAERREQILDAALKIAVARRLERLTIRDVAREAGLSSGLVLFHFKSRDGLVRALLAWMLQQNSVLQLNPPWLPADDSLADLIRDQCRWLVSHRERTELFFDFWVAGTRHPALRRGMRAALVRYRQIFRAVAAKTLARQGRLPAGVTAEGVAAAAVSFVHGCAIQAVMDPGHFQLDAVLGLADALTGDTSAAGRRRDR
jgi:TetR/AcrR family transcriptional regulator, transcriptional repressor of bet genes